jgi:hypothetical protein
MMKWDTMEIIILIYFICMPFIGEPDLIDHANKAIDKYITVEAPIEPVKLKDINNGKPREI